MKWSVPWLLALPLVAGEIEGTAWYDAGGELVVVEGAGAEPAPTPFVAEWRKREIERREARHGQWTSEIRPIRSRRDRSRGYGGSGRFWGCRPFYAGWRGNNRYHGGVRGCGGHGYRSGGSLIIRW